MLVENSDSLLPVAIRSVASAGRSDSDAQSAGDKQRSAKKFVHFLWSELGVFYFIIISANRAPFIGAKSGATVESCAKIGL